MNTNRCSLLLKAMEQEEYSQILISDSAAIFYLTGKWIHPGERMLALYLNQNGSHKLVVNELFPIQEDLGVELVLYSDTQSPVEVLEKVVEKGKPLGIDKNWPARFLLPMMEKELASKYVNASILLDRIRLIKDADEIEKMRKASKINDEAMEQIQDCLTKKMTEKELAEHLLKIYETLGAEGFSFDPIIGCGVATSDPHHSTGNAIPQKGDTVTIDIGCIKDNYCSDMTRTVFVGEPTPRQREIYEIVKGANLAAIAAVKPGVRFCDVDKAARDYITAKGYGERFLHRTGHSIGLECHEFGDVSAVNQSLLEPGMIFSIEPGVYLEGEFGVRIEDLVLVTEDGCEVLNHSSKECIAVK